MVTKECMFCGRVLEKSKKYVCEKCQTKIDALKQIKKLDAAKSKMKSSSKKHIKKIYEYNTEYDLVLDKIINQQYYFASADEICVALQLEKEKIEYYSNYKIGNYKVDFLLPVLKRVIEVDGESYHNDPDKDFLRERSIMRSLGEDFEIVRLPASEVSRYIIENLKESIEFVISKRNLDKRFRDTRWDERYFGEYLSLQRYLRKKGEI